MCGIKAYEQGEWQVPPLRSPAQEKWEPVEDGYVPELDDTYHKVRVEEGGATLRELHWEGYENLILLPDNLRLCRRK